MNKGKLNKRHEISALIFLAVALLLSVSYYIPSAATGLLGQVFLGLGLGVFGVPAYVLPALFLYGAIEFMVGKGADRSRRRLLHALIILMIVSAFFQLFGVDRAALEAAAMGNDGKVKATETIKLIWKSSVSPDQYPQFNIAVTGGVIGGLLSYGLEAVAGVVGAAILMGAAILAELVVFLGLSVSDVFNRTGAAMKKTTDRMNDAITRSRERRSEPAEDYDHIVDGSLRREMAGVNLDGTVQVGRGPSRHGGGKGRGLGVPLFLRGEDTDLEFDPEDDRYNEADHYRTSRGSRYSTDEQGCGPADHIDEHGRRQRGWGDEGDLYRSDAQDQNISSALELDRESETDAKIREGASRLTGSDEGFFHVGDADPHGAVGPTETDLAILTDLPAWGSSDPGMRIHKDPLISPDPIFSFDAEGSRQKPPVVGDTTPHHHDMFAVPSFLRTDPDSPENMFVDIHNTTPVSLWGTQGEPEPDLYISGHGPGVDPGTKDVALDREDGLVMPTGVRSVRRPGVAVQDHAVFDNSYGGSLDTGMSERGGSDSRDPDMDRSVIGSAAAPFASSSGHVPRSPQNNTALGRVEGEADPTAVSKETASTAKQVDRQPVSSSISDDELPEIEGLLEGEGEDQARRSMVGGSSVAARSFDVASVEENEPYHFPDIELLAPDKGPLGGQNRESIQNMAKTLIETLESFGVQAKVVNITTGPSITRFELTPGPGVKVSKIVNLADDIALSLAAIGLRIEAPIPGKSAIGIELPNEKTQVVTLRSLIESPGFQNARSKLTVALGRDIPGNPVLCDLAAMPHLLIAGATGSGKSVCINSILISLLYKASPEDVKLILIDPKVVELSVYNGIPHLLTPVVTDPKKAANTLNWAVVEMDRRYNEFAEYHVRDVKAYNNLAQHEPDLPHMPLILVVIDELADLMMTAPGDVEEAIVRLTQKARAAGIHLIIATQRPSVDVITGLIKANIPSRIAFAVSSQVDSRTILDMGGAEKLLGKGDMLYDPQSSNKPLRSQGAFVTDGEVESVIRAVRDNNPSSYDAEIVKAITSATKSGSGGDGENGEEEDDLLPAAVEMFLDVGHASIALLQRRLKIGYPRASRIVDELEIRGWIGPFDGSKPRKMILTKSDWDALKQAKEAEEGGDMGV